jgi:hypothetical protein
MSILDALLALLDRVLARHATPVTPDDPVARMIARTSVRLRPTPGYRRRLRGHVVNQYVAVREGLAAPAPRGRQMGRIGRSVLVASLGLAVSVTTVGAASQGSLPGDALYPVKRQLEQLRMEIAPGWVRPTLVALALDERLSEVEALARDARWDKVAGAVADVDAAEAALAAAVGEVPQDQQEELARHTQVLTALLARAPEAARPGLQQALAATGKAAVLAAAHGTPSSGAANSHNGQGGNGTGNGKGNGQPSVEPSPSPATSPPGSDPKPTASPKPSTRPTSPPHPTNSPPGQS